MKHVLYRVALPVRGTLSPSDSSSPLPIFLFLFRHVFRHVFQCRHSCAALAHHMISCLPRTCRYFGSIFLYPTFCILDHTYGWILILSSSDPLLGVYCIR